MDIFFGTPQGVKIGDVFPDRESVKTHKIHRNEQRGIDASREGASAIVLSGGYEDDIDYGDEILYTGEGGNANGAQIEHQSFESPGNKGLLISFRKKMHIRVIRSWQHKSPFSPKQGYKYCGLFEIIDKPELVFGKSGFKVCRFRLRKIDALQNEDIIVKSGCIVTIKGENMANKAIYSLDVDASEANKLSSISNLGRALLNKKVGDKIDFGSGFQIIDIREYQSRQ